jgi:hypothetical protein
MTLSRGSACGRAQGDGFGDDRGAICRADGPHRSGQRSAQHLHDVGPVPGRTSGEAGVVGRAPAGGATSMSHVGVRSRSGRVKAECRRRAARARRSDCCCTRRDDAVLGGRNVVAVRDRLVSVVADRASHWWRGSPRCGRRIRCRTEGTSAPRRHTRCRKSRSRGDSRSAESAAAADASSVRGWQRPCRNKHEPPWREHESRTGRRRGPRTRRMRPQRRAVPTRSPRRAGRCRHQMQYRRSVLPSSPCRRSEHETRDHAMRRRRRGVRCRRPVRIRRGRVYTLERDDDASRSPATVPRSARMYLRRATFWARGERGKRTASESRPPRGSASGSSARRVRGLCAR